MLLFGFSIWWVILPLFAAQYALAIFCLTRLAFCEIPLKVYIAWNLVCLLVFFIGSFVFLVYYYTHKSTLLKKTEQKQDYIIKDAPIYDNKNTENTANTANGENNIANTANTANPENIENTAASTAVNIEDTDNIEKNAKY